MEFYYVDVDEILSNEYSMCQMKNMNELYIIIQVIPEELKLKVILWINGIDP